jgi:hypothetical protein
VRITSEEDRARAIAALGDIVARVRGTVPVVPDEIIDVDDAEIVDEEQMAELEAGARAGVTARSATARAVLPIIRPARTTEPTGA